MGSGHWPGIMFAFVIFALTGGAGGASEGPSLTGAWRIVRFEPAPWAQASPAAFDRALGFLNSHLEFEARRAVGREPFGCASARYESLAIPTKGLFQGNLVDDKQVRRLGITRSPVPSVRLQCDTGVFDFHFIGPDKAVTALDNFIYVLARQAPDRAAGPRSIKAACQPWLQPSGSSKRHPLDSASVVNDPPTVKEPQAPATLHPDTETTKGNVLVQTWTLADYRNHPLYLRCRYEGTTVDDVQPIPDDAAACRMSIGWDAKRHRVDASLSPLALECR